LNGELQRQEEGGRGSPKAAIKRTRKNWKALLHEWVRMEENMERDGNRNHVSAQNSLMRRLKCEWVDQGDYKKKKKPMRYLLLGNVG